MKSSAIGPVLGVVFVCTVLFGVAASSWQGQDWSFDHGGYHFYTAFAFLTGRWRHDFAVAGINSYTNPLIYIPPYLAITQFAPRTASLLIGAVHGLNLFVVYLTARSLFQGRRPNGVLILAALAVAACGPMFFSEIGTTIADISTSLFVLCGVWLALEGLRREASSTWFAAAAAMVAAAVGLKLTNAPFLIALGLAVPLARPQLTTVATLVAGGVAGGLITNGYWALQSLLLYGNPVFPMYNAFFRSPDMTLINFVDSRWGPRSLLEAIVAPFQWVVGQHVTSEIAFRDARFAVAFVLVVLALIRQWRPGRTGLSGNGGDATGLENVQFRFLAGFFVLSFAVWSAVFGYQRYLLPLELVCGPIVAAAAVRAASSGRLAACFAALAVLLVVRVDNWGRVPWRDTWHGVAAPPALANSSAFFMYETVIPGSYVLPYLPTEAVAINFGPGLPMPPGRTADLRARAAAAAVNSGTVRFLSNFGEFTQDARAALHRYGLRITPDCVPFATYLQHFVACRLAPSGPTVETATEYEIGRTVLFGADGGGGWPYRGPGWYPSGAGTYAADREATLRFRMPPLTARMRLRLTVELEGNLVPKPARAIRVRANALDLDEVHLTRTRPRVEVTLCFGSDLVEVGGLLNVTFVDQSVPASATPEGQPHYALHRASIDAIPSGEAGPEC
jgi:hypothetical protein